MAHARGTCAGRTGLYWVAFLLLILLGLAKKLAGRRLLQAPLVLFLALAAGWFAFELNTTRYAEWRYDAGTKGMVKLLGQQRGARNTRLAVSWFLIPSVDFYRRLDGLDWLQVFDVSELKGDADFFLLVSQDAPPDGKTSAHALV